MQKPDWDKAAASDGAGLDSIAPVSSVPDDHLKFDMAEFEQMLLEPYLKLAADAKQTAAAKKQPPTLPPAPISRAKPIRPTVPPAPKSVAKPTPPPLPPTTKSAFPALPAGAAAALAANGINKAKPPLPTPPAQPPYQSVKKAK